MKLPKIGDRGKLNPATVPSDVYAHRGSWTLEVIDIFKELSLEILEVRVVAKPDYTFTIYPEDLILCKQ